MKLDTGPFVKGAQKLMEYYNNMQIDLFKQAISCPGVSRILLFQHGRDANCHFASFSEQDADAYQTIKKCCFGGPSVIFKRYAKVNETCIRNNPEVLCNCNMGMDCNSMSIKTDSCSVPHL